MKSGNGEGFLDHSPKNDRTVFVSGTFNILHPGHLRLLRFASELGDHLIVGVQSDRIAGSEAHVPEQLRLDGVLSNSFVDEAFVIDELPSVVLKHLRPDIVVKGKEHRDRPNPELTVLNRYGGQLIFSSGEAVFSSLDLIRRDTASEGQRFGQTPVDYLARQRIDATNVGSVVDEFGTLSVCVIGDLIVDEYVTCDPLGMSQEDPTIVVTPIDTQRFLGGAGVVAAHGAGLGAQVHFLSVAGNDETRSYATDELISGGVDTELFPDDTRPTTLKQRFRANGMTLLRVSHLHQTSISLDLQERIFNRFDQLAAGCQLLVFSDFNYGCLPQPLVDGLIERARDSGLVVVADSQCSSQIGDVSRFRGMDLLTPTEHEARLSLRNQEDGLVVLAEKLRARSQAKNIILKLGSEGALLHLHDSNDLVQTDRIPALNSLPLDVAGAGDSLLVGSAMAMAVGASPWVAAYIGAAAAAFQVGSIGNRPLTVADLKRELI